MTNDRERLNQVLASYGSDPARWPEADRRLAGLASDREEAAAIDDLLSQASTLSVPAGARERLMAHVSTRTVHRDNVVVLRPRSKSPFWMSVTALAASLALGIFIGAQDDFADVLPFGQSVSVDDAAALMGLEDVEDALGSDLS